VTQEILNALKNIADKKNLEIRKIKGRWLMKRIFGDHGG
jgi:hypothetical protein